MKFSPIILFVYNRPWHTRKTIEALQKNLLADQSDLVIYSDAPKRNSDEQKVTEVRNLIKTVKGFKNLIINERKENYGLARSIITGVTETIDKYGRVIVLEDDIITSKYFLKYMNEALEIHKSEDRVMHISGYMYPIDPLGLPETFFLKPTT